MRRPNRRLWALAASFIITASAGCASPGHLAPLSAALPGRALARIPTDRLLAAAELFERQQRTAQARQLYAAVLDQEPSQPLAKERIAIMDRGDRRQGDHAAVGTIAVAGKHTSTVQSQPVAQAAPPDWSPDGTRIAFIAGNRRSIRRASPESGETSSILNVSVGDRDCVPTSLCWRISDGRTVFNSATPAWIDSQDMFSLAPETGEIKPITNDRGKQFSTSHSLSCRSGSGLP